MCTISHPHTHTHSCESTSSPSVFLYHIKICNLHLMSVSPPSSFSFTPHTVAASFQMRFYHKKYAIFLCIGSTKGARRLFIFEKNAVIKKSWNWNEFFLHEFPQILWWKMKICPEVVKEAEHFYPPTPVSLLNYFCLLSQEGKENARRK